MRTRERRLGLPGGARTSAPRSRRRIGRLQGDNAALKKELLARGLPLPSGVKAEPPAVSGGDKSARASPPTR